MQLYSTSSIVNVTISPAGSRTWPTKVKFSFSPATWKIIGPPPAVCWAVVFNDLPRKSISRVCTPSTPTGIGISRVPPHGLTVHRLKTFVQQQLMVDTLG